jgi:lactate permease
LLVLSFQLGAVIQRASFNDMVATVANVAHRLLPVLIALIAMLGLSRIMVHAGMIDALASATASNILFTEFQVATAQQLGFSVLAMVAPQGFGAAIGNIICPHNIVAASATVQLVGREGVMLRQTVVVALAYTLFGGLLAWLAFT